MSAIDKINGWVLYYLLLCIQLKINTYTLSLCLLCKKSIHVSSQHIIMISEFCYTGKSQEGFSFLAINNNNDNNYKKQKK